MRKLFLLISVLFLAITAKATIPSTDFTGGYQFTGSTAALEGNIEFNTAKSEESSDHYLRYFDREVNGTATWEVTATKACWVSVTLNMFDNSWNNAVSTAYKNGGHIFAVQLLNTDDSPVTGSSPVSEGGESEAIGNIDLSGAIRIPAAGTYHVQLQNSRDYSKCGIYGITLTRIILPETDFAAPGYVLTANNAIVSGNVEYNTEKGEDVSTHYLRYYDAATPGTAIWKIHATRSCYIQATLNMIDNTWKEENPRAYYKNSGHIFAVQLLYLDETSVEGSVAVAEPEESSAYNNINLPGAIYVPEEGDYIIKLSNTRAHSKCGIQGVTLVYSGGDIVDVPVAELPFAHAILSSNATRSLSPTEIHFGSPNASQYAKWNVNATAGLYDVTINFTGTNYGHYELNIMDSNNNNIFSERKDHNKSGSETFSGIYLPANGKYVLQLANTNSGADGYLTSVAVTASSSTDIFIVDEDATDDSYIVDGTSGKKALLKRTFTAGMYNTLCIPVEPGTPELTRIFGEGYEIVEMESAELEGDILNLNFKPVTSSLSACKPYLVKPTKDVFYPKFDSHTIHVYSWNISQHGTDADFIGSLAAIDLTPDVNTLFLAANNMLYYPAVTIPLKGTRAYFQVHAPAGVSIRRARINDGKGQSTDIELIGEQEQQNIIKAQKVLQNGQIFIIRDGVKYNALGIRIE